MQGSQIRDVFKKPKGLVGLVLRDPKTQEIIKDVDAIRSVMQQSTGKIIETTLENVPKAKFLKDIFVSEEGEIALAGNLVVSDARANMSRLIAGDTNTSGERYVTKMSWGGAGHDGGDPTTAVPPSASDSALGAEITSVGTSGKKAVTYDFPDATTVRFISTLSESDAVGEGLSEAGLWTDDGTLFARKTFGLISKSSAFSFEFRWRILF
jgi:hypothetical protein